MFDLFRSRAKAVRYLLGAIMLLVALSMVVTLIPGFVGASYSSDSNIVAEIGDEVLTVRDVQVNIQQSLRDNRHQLCLHFPKKQVVFDSMRKEIIRFAIKAEFARDFGGYFFPETGASL